MGKMKACWNIEHYTQYVQPSSQLCKLDSSFRQSGKLIVNEAVKTDRNLSVATAVQLLANYTIYRVPCLHFLANYTIYRVPCLHFLHLVHTVHCIHCVTIVCTLCLPITVYNVYSTMRQNMMFTSGIFDINFFNIALLVKCISQYTDIPYLPQGVYCEILSLGNIRGNIAHSGRGIIRINSPVLPYLELHYRNTFQIFMKIIFCPYEDPTQDIQ